MSNILQKICKDKSNELEERLAEASKTQNEIKTLEKKNFKLVFSALGLP